MKDQEIYKLIGSLMYNEAPRLNDVVRIVAYVTDRSVDRVIWCGDKLSSETSIKFSDSANSLITQKLIELNNYFVKENMGIWNITSITLNMDTKNFNIDFEFNKDLDSGKLSFWKYTKLNLSS